MLSDFTGIICFLNVISSLFLISSDFCFSDLVDCKFLLWYGVSNKQAITVCLVLVLIFGRFSRAVRAGRFGVHWYGNAVCCMLLKLLKLSVGLF